MTIKLLSVVTFLLLPSLGSAQYTIAIQPLGDFDTNLVSSLVPVITSQFNSPKIIVLPGIALPSKAYYQPRNRYRAEILLEVLDSLRGNRYTRILGLTQADISTTKGEYPDWGIFGYGAINGGPCVVSTHRLRKNADTALLQSRFHKVVIHELGHTFGLEHCPESSCIMTDYKGTIVSLDRSMLTFCIACKVRLVKAVKFLSI